MMWVMQSGRETALVAGHWLGLQSRSLGCNAVQGDRTKEETESSQISATSSPSEELQSVGTQSQNKNDKKLHTLP